jgi:hypothetical protein
MTRYDSFTQADLDPMTRLSMTHSYLDYSLLCLLMDESLWLILGLLILIIPSCLLIPIWSHLNYWSWVLMTHYDSLLIQLDYWSITVHLLITLTHGLVLYLDMDPPVYKSALDVPKTSDLTWLFSQIPCTPYTSWLVAILVHSSKPLLSEWFLGTLNHSRRRLLVRPYPLVSTIYFHLERQAPLPWTGLSPDPKTSPQTWAL